MGDANGNPLQHIGNAEGSALDIVNTVVEVINLAAPLNLPAYGVTDNLPVVLHDIGLDRQPILGRLLNGGHVLYPRKGHVKGAGYRGGRQGKHIHLTAHLLDMLLMGHAKALFLVHNKKSQILEKHVLLQEPVGAYNYIHQTAFQVPERLPYLGGGAEAG